MAGDDAGTDAGASSIPPSEAGGRPPLDTVDSEGGGPSSMGGMVGPPSPLTGCYLLIILGEPHSEEHKDNILQHLLKGFLSWDVADCHVDLEEELNTITKHAPEGEEARYGERLIQYASENLVTEVLIHPQYNTLIQCMRNMLSSFTRHRHIIHAGYTFSGNGSWILQDGTFSVGDFAEAFQEHDVQRVIRAYADTITMNIHCADAGLWHTLPDKSYARLCKIRINPVDVLDTSSESINAFIDYLAPMLVPTSIRELLETSDVVGNIRFTHPTLYVFPGGQGDAALFGINGFNMLVDGGFNRKACFWDFVRHLDRLDAVLMTRLNNSNIQGLSSVVERKRDAPVYPQIGHFFSNIPDRKGGLPSPDGDKDRNPLLIDLFERGHNLVSDLKSLDLKPQTCYRAPEPINLYHKVGHGTLDMYVISPSRDSREVKEFLQKWNSGDQRLFAARDSKDFNFPLQNLVSICALLVWQPANPDDTITRILFPGSTPDYKIQEGLEKIKHLEFMKHSTCTAKSIAPAIQTVVTTRKTLKSAIEPSGPIMPSKPGRFVPPAATAATLATMQQQDNKMKESVSSVVAEEEKIEKIYQEEEKMAAFKKKEDSIETADEQAVETGDEAMPEQVAETTSKEEEDQVDQAIEAEVDNKESTEKKVEVVIVKPQPQAPPPAKEIIETAEPIKPAKPIKAKADKPRAEVKPLVRSRIDTRPPKSMERKVVKKDEKKSSPTATPRKQDSAKPPTREVKAKVGSRPAKASPSSTPAKSAKEANNRKVFESKQQSIRQTSTTTSTRRETTRSTVSSTEKRETKTAEPRKPISRRPRGASPSKRAPGSPVKAVKPKAADLKKARLDKGGTTDSSLVSTPSADDAAAAKKLQELTASQELDVEKQRELDDLKEEQEVVREIEAVFSRDEMKRHQQIKAEIREVTKQDSTTEAEEDDEYLIIEKEEITEDSIVEQEESSVTKEEEIQKHQRDSQESEKKRKRSAEEEIEAAIAKVEAEERKAKLETEPSAPPPESPEPDETAQEVEADDEAEAEAKEEAEVAEKEIEADADADTKLELTTAVETEIKAEVQEIITTAKEIVTSKTDEHLAKTEEDISSVTPDERISSAKKTSDTKDDLVGLPVEVIPANLQESLPEERFSATIESGATTAPTLPEDERIPLDEIKEDLAIEEKYVKEETKEVEAVVASVSALTSIIPPSETSAEPKEILAQKYTDRIVAGIGTAERILPIKMAYDSQQMRDVVKTPDEVADLPMHEEADMGLYEKDAQESGKSISHKEELAKEEKEEEEKVTEIEEEDEEADEAEKDTKVTKEDDEEAQETVTAVQQEDETKDQVPSPTDKGPASPGDAKKIVEEDESRDVEETAVEVKEEITVVKVAEAKEAKKPLASPEEKEVSEITSEDEIPAQMPSSKARKEEKLEDTVSVESPPTIEEAIEVEVQKSLQGSRKPSVETSKKPSAEVSKETSRRESVSEKTAASKETSRPESVVDEDKSMQESKEHSRRESVADAEKIAKSKEPSESASVGEASRKSSVEESEKAKMSGAASREPSRPASVTESDKQEKSVVESEKADLTVVSRKTSVIETEKEQTIASAEVSEEPSEAASAAVSEKDDKSPIASRKPSTVAESEKESKEHSRPTSVAESKEEEQDVESTIASRKVSVVESVKDAKPADESKAPSEAVSAAVSEKDEKSPIVSRKPSVAESVKDSKSAEESKAPSEAAVSEKDEKSPTVSRKPSVVESVKDTKSAEKSKMPSEAVSAAVSEKDEKSPTVSRKPSVVESVKDTKSAEKSKMPSEAVSAAVSEKDEKSPTVSRKPSVVESVKDTKSAEKSKMPSE
uniref:Microtubule-associated protein futsch n=1 Tax=Musca domestica TaxID=7370 RepID=A0A1I8N0Y2_MUSDO